MRLLESQLPVDCTDECAVSDLHLRLRADGRLVELAPGKITIGSGPRCQLRLQMPGVEPLHCLIVANTAGLSVRRWGSETLLNEEPFDEAPLRPGDCLRVGSVELDIIGRPNPAAAFSAVVEPREDKLASATATEPVQPHECASPTATESFLTIGALQERLRHDFARIEAEIERLIAAQAEANDQRTELERTIQQQFTEQTCQISELHDIVRTLGEQLAEAIGTRPVAPQGQGWLPKHGEETVQAAERPDDGYEEPTDNRSSDISIESAEQNEIDIHLAAVARLLAAGNDDSVPEPTVDSEPENASKPATEPSKNTSFIERYSHLLSEDESSHEPSAGANPTLYSSTPASVDNQSEAPRAFPETKAVSNDDEESIEQYMAKLLERVRGQSAESAPPAEPPPTPNPKRQRSDNLNDLARAALNLSNEADNNASAEADSELEAIANPISELPRAVCLTPPTDLGALRAVANQSARLAISRHALKKHGRDAVTKVILSMLAGLASLWLMLDSQDWLTLQFVTACISLMLAAYWAGEAFRALLMTLREKTANEREGYIEEYDDFNLPLPIDIDQPRQ